jgi:hypothetical protein
MNTKGEVVWWAEIKWPREFLYKAEDEKGANFGCKSTTPEAVGLLLPFLSIYVPEELKGREVVFYVDNKAVVYGMG